MEPSRNLRFRRLERLVTILALLAGCSTVDPPEPLAVFAGMDVVAEHEVVPVAVPPSAQPTVCEVDGAEMLAYTVPEAERLEARLVALNANSAMLTECAATVRDSEAERRALIETGRHVEDRANWLQGELAGETQAHRDERREHLIDNLLHRLIFIIGIAVGL